jgi:hypothetical protein
MTDEKEIPQGWQRSNHLLYTLEEDGRFRGKMMYRNRLTVRVDGSNSSATESEVDELATRLHAFLSAPTPASSVLVGEGAAESYDLGRAYPVPDYDAPQMERWMQHRDIDTPAAAARFGWDQAMMRVADKVVRPLFKRFAPLSLLGSGDAEVEGQATGHVAAVNVVKALNGRILASLHNGQSDTSIHNLKMVARELGIDLMMEGGQPNV